MYGIQDCDRSILADPAFLKPYLRRALALKAIGRVEEAIEAYRMVLTKASDNSVAAGDLLVCQKIQEEKKKGAER